MVITAADLQHPLKGVWGENQKLDTHSVLQKKKKKRTKQALDS